MKFSNQAAVVALACCFCMAAFAAHAAEGTWKPTVGAGNWSLADNWVGGVVPDAANDGATIAPTVAGATTVHLDQPIELGWLQLHAANVGITLDGAGPLTFERSEAALLETLASSSQRSYIIIAPVASTTAAGLVVSTGENGTLALRQGLSTTTGDVVKRGGGQLNLSGVVALADRLVIEQGSVSFDGTFAADGVAVASSGELILLGSGRTIASPVELAGGQLTSSGTTSQQAFVTGPLTLSGDSRVRAVSRLNLDGVISGPRGISYVGSNQVFVRGANTYGGLTQIFSGTVNAVSSQALGTTAAPTEVRGGILNIQLPTLEPLKLLGGVVNLGPTVTTADVTLRTGTLQLPAGVAFTSPIVLDNSTDQGQIRGSGAGGLLTGGVTGVGDLRLDGSVTVEGSPLAHQGKLIVSGGSLVTLNSANTFNGGVEIRSGTTVVNHAGALGTASTPITLTAGTLTLNKLVNRPVHMDQGELALQELGVAFEHEIRNARGIVRTEGVVNGPVILAGSDPSNSTSLRLIGGTYNGAISGPGAVEFSGGQTGPLKLQGANTFTGPALIRQTVDANSATALGTAEAGTLVSYGTLNINAATDERLLVGINGQIHLNARVGRLPLFLQSEQATGTQRVTINARGNYEEHLELAQGLMEVNAGVGLGSVTIRRGGRLHSKGGALLEIGEEVDLQGGQMSGRITAPGIRKTTSNGAVLEALPDFDGTLTVEGGRLEVYDGGFGSTMGHTIVTGGRNAQLMTRGNMTFYEDIFLQNATGPDGLGGLFIAGVCCSTPTAIMAGRLDLGSTGSSIGSGDGRLSTFGPITGGSLTITTHGLNFRVYGSANTYTGATHVRGGSLEILQAGNLSTTSKIVLYEDEDSWDGALYINNLEGARTNRIADTIPIEFRGGSLSSFGDETNEKLGRFDLVAGHSAIGPEGLVTAQSLNRSRGATVSFDEDPLAVVEAPATVNGILPWARVWHSGFVPHEVFGTFAGGRVVPLPATAMTTGFGAAGPTSNVSFRTDETLAGDRTINSLMFVQGRTLNLGGHTLTLSSGGILGPGTIRNGNVTAGADSGNEIILPWSSVINANVVDGPGGPLTVTVGSGTSDLGGNNTYTGGTIVNEAELRLTAETALPAGSDLNVIGGKVTVHYSATGPKHLGHVRLESAGSIQGGHFSFDEVIIEAGAIRSRVSGNGLVRKTTAGYGEINAETPTSTFNGDIVVDEGTLRVDGLPQAKFAVNGGKLQLITGSNPVTLNGGELAFYQISSPVTVLSRSTISAETLSRSFGSADFEGTFRGAGDLVFDGEVGTYDVYTPSATPIEISKASPDYSGNVEVRTAWVRSLHPLGLGTGDVGIFAGGTLEIAPPFGTTSFNIQNDVTLHGGQLFGRVDGSPLPRLQGSVQVAGRSILGGADVVGPLHLADGSLLTTRNASPTRLLGDTIVEGTAEIRVGRAESSEFSVGVLTVGGRVVAGADESVLNFVNSGLDRYELTGSFHVPVGRSLALLEDGEPISLVLDAAGQGVSGGGTLLNPVTLAAGGVLRPGSSVGELATGPLTLQAGGIYEWEINNLDGVPGGPVGWDVLDVDGPLTFDVAAGETWTLKIAGLPPEPPTGPPLASYQWVIADTEGIDGFDPAQVKIEIGNLASLLPGATANQFELSQSGGQLLLSYTIPEPGTATLVGVAIASGYVVRRLRERRLSLR